MARRRGNKLLPGDLELRIDQSLKRDFTVKWVCPHPDCADKPSYETSREALEPHFTQVHRALLQARRIIVKKDLHGQRAASSLATPAHAAAPGDLLTAVDDGAGARAGAGAGGRARDGGGAASGSGAGEKANSGKRCRGAEGKMSKEDKRTRKEAETLADVSVYSKCQGDLEPGACARYGDKCVGAELPRKACAGCGLTWHHVCANKHNGTSAKCPCR